MTIPKLFFLFLEVEKLCQDNIDEKLNDPKRYSQEECDSNTQFWLGAKKGNKIHWEKILEKFDKENFVESKN